ncbi:MAG: 50S ribosomal protein L17 [Patescibacteria group bacterium]
MKHLHSGRTLGRKDGARKGLLKSLAKSLILHDKITTTEAKAKEIRPIVEKLVTKGKKGDLHNRRQIISALGDELLAKKLIEDIGKKYEKRNGGYLRITKIGVRPGDATRKAIIEFV